MRGTMADTFSSQIFSAAVYYFSMETARHLCYNSMAAHHIEIGETMKEILFLEPVFKETIWGGSRLGTEWLYDIPSDHTGECWAISAHPHGDCIIKNGQYSGRHLSWLWENHREYFHNLPGPIFPLLIKIIDAREDLSIQVHPDNAYAYTHEHGALGKNECWYVLNCKRDGEIVYGHNARTKEELKAFIEKQDWNHLIRTLPIKPGDFLQISPGTVHAIKAGTVLLEVQQPSDITYRLYDYGRLQNGVPRELHITKAIDVIHCPHRDEIIETYGQAQMGDLQIIPLISSKNYTVRRIRCRHQASLNQCFSFLAASVIKGNGTVDGVPIRQGSHFILPYNYGKYTYTGNLTVIEAYL